MKQIISPDTDITGMQRIINEGHTINSISLHTTSIVNGSSFVISYTVVYTPKKPKKGV